MMSDTKTKEREEWIRDHDKRIRSEYTEYLRTGRITSNLMLSASIARSYWDETPEQERHKRYVPELTQEEARGLHHIQTKVHALTKVFEGAVWYLGGVQDLVVQCRNSGMSGKGADWSVMLYTMAGRCLITLRDTPTEESLTLITADNEREFTRLEWGNTGMGPMGIQGWDCTEETALRLIRLAITSFPAVGPDEKVGLGF